MSKFERKTCSAETDAMVDLLQQLPAVGATMESCVGAVSEMPEDAAAVQEATRLDRGPLPDQGRDASNITRAPTRRQRSPYCARYLWNLGTRHLRTLFLRASCAPKASLLRARCLSEPPRTASRATTNIVTYAAEHAPHRYKLLNAP
ncbi:hypothetical protein FCIRC_1225 [Fusarium circinatum]|uniref:Uncharacterized protein n=1 Tax=Fusarium circinatum TaxID=48490 RepID=A0A8H5X709_FUSCI|nr:hypothetical protein FCIRC_1225 [Fusarium circinatum]